MSESMNDGIEIEAKKYNLGQIFSESFLFEIPEFQRPFSWNAENFDKLFEDIYDMFKTDEKSEYFLGSIILRKEKGNISHIIDGQQRLFSLAILLAVIRDNTTNEEMKNSIQDSLYEKGDEFKEIPTGPRIKVWEELRNIEDYIFNPSENKNIQTLLDEIKKGIRKPKDKKDPLYSLQKAIEIFTQKYNNYILKNGLEKKFLNYLFTKVYVVVISTESLPYAIRLFNVLNTRGLPLTTADILKAKSLEKISEKDKRKKYANIWRSVEREIGRDKLEKVIEFIRTMKIKQKAKKSILEEYEEKIFKESILKEGEEFINYVEKIANRYKALVLEPESPHISSEYKNLVGLMRDFIPFDDWIPPLIRFFEKFENRAFDYLLTFLKKLEKKTVIEWVAGYTPTKRIKSLNSIINLIDNTDSPEDIIRKIDSEIKKGTIDDFVKAIDDKDFYHTNYAKYLLLRIELKKVDQENFKGYGGIITIERILPQNPPENSEWCKYFTKEQREEFTNRIGNLVLLGRRKNSAARNFDFQTKKEKYFLKGEPPFLITRELKNIEKWTPVEFEKRQKEMINTLKEIYCINKT